MTSSRRGRIISREAIVERLEVEDGVRVATLATCPYCGHAGHRHVVPADVLETAPLERAAQCNAARGVYRLLLPGVKS